jgi:hypothetical protein
VSGFIGFNTLVSTLEAGYRVREVVRKLPQVGDIKHKLPGKLEANVEFAVVENIAAENAFGHLIEGVSFVLHIAPPLNKPVSTEDRLWGITLT